MQHKKILSSKLILVQKMTPYLDLVYLVSCIHARVKSELDYCNAIYIDLP